jgi:transcriptional regulator with XRE-family HTH domain
LGYADEVVAEDLGDLWPRHWTTEAEKKARYPRKAAHWFASIRTRREATAKFNAEVDALIARRIRSERVLAGIRQIDLAEAIGVTQSTISRMESGKRPPTLGEVIRISIQLRVPLRFLFLPPPRDVPMTGWHRRPVLPMIPRDHMEAALRDELPDDDPMYE